MIVLHVSACVNTDFTDLQAVSKDFPRIFSSLKHLNIPNEFPSAVRWYGNHFLDSLLCIPNDNFYRNIRKGCYAPQMRQGLDKYFYRNGHIIKHKKGDSRVLELWFPNFQIRDFIAPEYSASSYIIYITTIFSGLQHFYFNILFSYFKSHSRFS